jgi:hypothetical protein
MAAAPQKNIRSQVFHNHSAENATLRGTAAMARKRAKKKTFSAVKAVKANARERVGQPKPERVLPSTSREQKRGAKHPKTLAKLLSEEA